MNRDDPLYMKWGFVLVIALVFVSIRLVNKFVPFAVFLSARHSTSRLSCTLARLVGIQNINIAKYPKQEAKRHEMGGIALLKKGLGSVLPHGEHENDGEDHKSTQKKDSTKHA